MNTTQLYARARERLRKMLIELDGNVSGEMLTSITLEDAGYLVRIVRKSDGMILAGELIAEEPHAE